MSDQQQKIFAIEKPHSNLFKYYLISAILTGPGFLVMFPLMLCRYVTLRYKFDEEGITVKWGLLFRKEVHLTYNRIQDIHLLSGIIQRWLGLADIQIQTAAGSSAAEMVIEGILEFEDVRDFLYSKMRGYRDSTVSGSNTAQKTYSVESDPSRTTELLEGILNELKASTEALHKLNESRGGDQ